MIKTSTPRPASPSIDTRKAEPCERTLAFLRQFARAYTAPLRTNTATPGIVLN